MENPSPRPLLSDISGGLTNITYRFQTGAVNQPTTTYQLCWGFDPGNNNDAYQEYKVSVGSFTMNGPTQGQVLACNLGAPCSITITGVGLTDTNTLMVISKYGGPCGSTDILNPVTRAVMPGLLSPRQVTNDASDDKYDLGVVTGGGSYTLCRVAEPRESCIGYHYRLCWSHGVDRAQDGDFPYLVDIGTFFLTGVYGTYSVECILGTWCTFNLYGLELAITNQVIIIESHGTCGAEDPPLATFEGLHNPRRAQSVATVLGTTDGSMQVTFRLGKSTGGRIGSYKLCWGLDPVSLAHFKAEVGPFHFLELPAQQSCSVWDNHCFQKAE